MARRRRKRRTSTALAPRRTRRRSTRGGGRGGASRTLRGLISTPMLTQAAGAAGGLIGAQILGPKAAEQWEWAQKPMAQVAIKVGLAAAAHMFAGRKAGGIGNAIALGAMAAALIDVYRLVRGGDDEVSVAGDMAGFIDEGGVGDFDGDDLDGFDDDDLDGFDDDDGIGELEDDDDGLDGIGCNRTVAGFIEAA